MRTAVVLLNFCIVSVLALAAKVPTAAAAAPRDDSAPSSHAVDVFRCDFSEAADTNYDLWPDGWSRLRGSGYPQYLKIGIVDDGPADGQRSLKIALDGGAGRVTSPAIPAGSRFSYVAEATIRTAGLQRDVAVLALTFLDEKKHVLEEIESQPLDGTTDWATARIGPIAPTSDQTRFATLSFHVKPTAAGEDLRGQGSIANVRLARLPRMTLRAEGLRNLYFSDEKVVVSTHISGMLAHDNRVEFSLLDPYGKTIATQKQTLEALQLPPVPGDTKASLAASATWQPPLPGPGFYRVRVSMVGDDGVALERTLALAMIEPQPPPAGGEFGWTLPDGERPLDFAPLATLLAQAGVNWVKFPTWYDEEDHLRADRIAWLSERLSINNIEMVGLLDQPPPSRRKLFGDVEQAPIASIFIDRELWEPALDAMMMKLSLKVHWWQLGADDDVSYVGFPDIDARIGEVRKSFARYGQEVRLGVVWQSQKPAPDFANAPWEFLSYSNEPALTAAEIGQQFGDATKKNGRRWLTLRPLAQGEYDVATRVNDLVQRMVATKASGVDTAFVPRPFHDIYGLFASDGTPGELFLPWRTTALAISGRKHLGMLRLPHGSTNQVFANEEEAVMVLWNDHPVREYAYLGEDVRCLSIWGQESKLPVETINGIRQQVIEVGPEPVILTGLNPNIMRWCLAFEFDHPQLESLFGREQLVGYKFRNTFDKGATGEITFSAPNIWDVSPAPKRIRLHPNEERRDSFPLLLKTDADSGQQDVRIDFRITADEEYHFSVFRTLNVGLDDILVELDSRLNDEGELLVKATVTNHTGRTVSFRSTLFPPERRREQRQLLYLGPDRVSITYRLPDGEELIGEDLRLRLEELGGSRVLNQHIKATP